MDAIIRDLEEIVKGEPFKVRPRLREYVQKLKEMRAMEIEAAAQQEK